MPEPDIQLTIDELAIFREIQFDQSKLTFENSHANADFVEKLFRMLAHRDAIPAQRRRWFLDAKFNLGGRGKSRQDQWARNGTSGPEVLRHPHFLEILEYFVCGPKLPGNVILQFREKVESCGLVTSGDVPVLSKFVRKLARSQALDAHFAAEEFYKLALDCKMTTYARYIYDGVKILR